MSEYTNKNKQKDKPSLRKESPVNIYVNGNAWGLFTINNIHLKVLKANENLDEPFCTIVY